MVNFKSYDVTDWTTNNYNVHIVQYLKKIIRTNWKSETFKVIGIVVLHQLRKLQLEWKGGGSKFGLFLSLFLPVDINFQYKLNSHKSLFIVTVNLFSSIALLIFSHLHFHSFISLIFLYKVFPFLMTMIKSMNINKWVLSLSGSSFVFNFNSRKSKQTIETHSQVWDNFWQLKAL